MDLRSDEEGQVNGGAGNTTEGQVNGEGVAVVGTLELDIKPLLISL